MRGCVMLKGHSKAAQDMLLLTSDVLLYYLELVLSYK